MTRITKRNNEEIRRFMKNGKDGFVAMNLLDACSAIIDRR